MHPVILGACEVAEGSAPGLALIMSKDLQAGSLGSTYLIHLSAIVHGRKHQQKRTKRLWSLRGNRTLGQDWRMPRRLAHLLHPCPWIAALFAAPCPPIALLRRWH